jgi:hypothetical protein
LIGALICTTSEHSRPYREGVSAFLRGQPLAAAVSPRYDVGNVQENGCTTIKSAAAKHNATMAMKGLVDTAMPNQERAQRSISGKKRSAHL